MFYFLGLMCTFPTAPLFLLYCFSFAPPLNRLLSRIYSQPSLLLSLPTVDVDSLLAGRCNELRRFTPQLRFVRIQGSAAERWRVIGGDALASGAVDVVVTTYETVTTSEGSGAPSS